MERPRKEEILILIYLSMIESEEDKSKFEQIYLCYRDLMFYVALKILQNEHDAEDAVHQAFLAILESLDKIAEVNSSKTRGFVVVIVERRAIDIIRSRQKIKLAQMDEISVEYPVPGDNPLAVAIAKLPPRYREAILLRYFHGYDTKELARMLDMKRASVDKLLWRAKEKLQKIIEEGAEA